MINTLAKIFNRKSHQLDPDLQAFIDELTHQSFAVVAAPARWASPVSAVFAAPQGLLGHSGANGPLLWSFKRQGELKESWAATFDNLCCLMMI